MSCWHSFSSSLFISVCLGAYVCAVHLLRIGEFSRTRYILNQTLESKLLKLSSVTSCMRLSCTVDNEFSLSEVKSCSFIYFSVKRRVLCSMCTNSSGRVDGSTSKIQERTGAFPSGSLNVNASVTAEIPVRDNSPLGEAPHSMFHVYFDLLLSRQCGHDNR